MKKNDFFRGFVSNTCYLVDPLCEFILCVSEAPLWHARPSRSVVIQQVCQTMQRLITPLGVSESIAMVFKNTANIPQTTMKYSC